MLLVRTESKEAGDRCLEEPREMPKRQKQEDSAASTPSWVLTEKNISQARTGRFAKMSFMHDAEGNVRRISRRSVGAGSREKRCILTIGLTRAELADMTGLIIYGLSASSVIELRILRSK